MHPFPSPSHPADGEQQDQAAPGSDQSERDDEEASGEASGSEDGEEEDDDEASSSGSESGSGSGSDDEEDGQPLAKRWSSKHELPKPTAPTRKRVNRFPKIPK